jgi:hypothetical protein
VLALQSVDYMVRGHNVTLTTLQSFGDAEKANQVSAIGVEVLPIENGQ